MSDQLAGRSLLEPRARRYPLELPVELGLLRGVTRDISVSGLRFETEEPDAATVHRGATVHVVILFPSAVYGRKYRLHVDGRVMRVEAAAGGLSIALCTEGFRFAEPVEPAVD